MINVGNPIYFFFKKLPWLGMVEIPHMRIMILGMVCEIGFTTLSSSVGILQNLLSGCIWMIILADLATFTRCKHLASKTRVESLQKLFWVWIYVHVLEVPVSPFKKNRVKHSETPTFHDFSGGVRKSHGGVSHIMDDPDSVVNLLKQRWLGDPPWLQKPPDVSPGIPWHPLACSGTFGDRTSSCIGDWHARCRRQGADLTQTPLRQLRGCI